MFSVLITGSSRGIGFNLVKIFLQRENKNITIIATCRNPETATELQKLKKVNDNVHIVKLDVEDTASIPKVAEDVEKIVGPNGLNVLINNAGVALAKYSTLDDIDVEVYKRMISTNTVAPVFIIKAFLPLLKRAAQVNEKNPMSIRRAAIINVTSLLGSVGLNELDCHNRYFGYSESKAALNQATRSICRILQNDKIITIVINPGWVQTDMGGSAASLTVDESISNLIKVFYGLNEGHNGKFLDYDGSELAW